MHPCRQPGCPALLPRSGYCPAHASKAAAPGRDYEAKRARTPHLAEAARLRSSAKWQRIRRIKLAQDPLCEDPRGDHRRRGTTATAQQVHHIRPLATHPELAFDLGNLMSLCTRCHAKLERTPDTPPHALESP
jgi:5-methylcytosine-specific restriction endonuclease McrA